MWYIIAYNRKDKLQPSAWQGQQYGEMQTAMNQLYKEGYKNFDIWETDKPSVKFKMFQDIGKKP